MELWKLSEGDRIYVVRNGSGKWETVSHVWAYMDMEDLVLKSGDRLPFEEYGITWEAVKLNPEMDDKVLELLDQHSFLARRSTNPVQSAYYRGLRNMADLICTEQGREIVYDEDTGTHRFAEI